MKIDCEKIELTANNSASSSIMIIYTGGTFGMIYSEKDVLVPFDFHYVLEKVPVLKGMGINLTVIAFNNPVDSSNIGITEWQAMSSLIYDHYDDFDGFVILHGTDTMAYSASAVSFMLKNLRKPVIFTGAQIPIGATRSDARENLITALEIASNQDNDHPLVREVCIYFDAKLIRGNRAQKSHTNDFDAFRSENYPILAEAGVEIAFNKEYLLQPGDLDSLEYLPEMDSNIALIRIFPNLPVGGYESLIAQEDLKGLIIESFGSGNVMADGSLLSLLEKRISEGLIVLNVSQCSGGRVVQSRYQTGRQLAKIGVISGYDLTTEAALAKLMHLLAYKKTAKEVQESLSTPMRGEMTRL